MHALLRIGERITVLPVIHGSADSALQVRRCMLEQQYDCLAVPLPPSFQADVERAIDLLPAPTVVWQSERPLYEAWSPEAADDDPSGRNQLCADRPMSGCDHRSSIRHG